MSLRSRRRTAQEAELDITSFMNLMIILVPVLLMSMVFSQITVLDLKLPDASNGAESQDQPARQLELVIRNDHLVVNYPAGVQLKRIERDENGLFDQALLTSVLQEIKRRLSEQDIEKRDILLLSESAVDYQTIVSVMDTVRSYKAVVAASVVDAELFPEISLGDAPVLPDTLAAR